MLNIHTGKRFRLRTKAGANPSLTVLDEQLDQVKQALIDAGVLFVMDNRGIYKDGLRFCVICFRPDVRKGVVEAALFQAPSVRRPRGKRT